MEKIYEGGYYGENLWEAICNSSYGSQDPPIVQYWIEEQTKEYMSKEWDHEFIKNYFEEFYDSQKDIFYDVLREHDIDIDDPFWNEINRDELLKWSEEYLSSKSEVMALTNFDALQKDYNDRMRKRKVCLDLYNRIKEDIDKDYEGKRWQKAYDRAVEDFNLFSPDIDPKNDDEVRQFFGKDLKLEGYVVDGEEYGISEVFICPNCKEARPIEKQKEDWYNNYHEDEGPYDSTVFICDDCGDESKFDEPRFLEVNKHLPEEEIVARCV